MSKNAAEFINELAIASGIDSEAPELKSLLADAKLSAITIPTTVSNGIQSGLMSYDAALNHPKVGAHFRQAHLTAADTKILETLAELEIGDEGINEIKGTKSTYDKIVASLKKVADVKTKLAATKASSDTGKSAEYQKTIDELNKKASDLVASFAAEKEALLSGFDNERKDGVLNNLLMGYEYAGEQPKEVQAKLARLLLQDALAQKGYKTEYENGNIVLKTNEGTKVFDNNKELTIKALTDKIVSDNKLIKVNAPAPGIKTPPTNPANFGNPAPAAGDNPFDRHLAATLQQLQEQS